MISGLPVRLLVTSAALAASLVLAGCNTNEISLAHNAKANQPVPPRLIQAMTEKNMDLNSPILVRIFKQEAELEVWKQDRDGRFALLKPIRSAAGPATSAPRSAKATARRRRASTPSRRRR